MSLYWIGFLVLRLLCAAFAILFVARIAISLRGSRPDGAKAALERRFVAGEIGEEEFLKMRHTLES